MSQTKVLCSSRRCLSIGGARPWLRTPKLIRARLRQRTRADGGTGPGLLQGGMGGADTYAGSQASRRLGQHRLNSAAPRSSGTTQLRDKSTGQTRKPTIGFKMQVTRLRFWG